MNFTPDELTNYREALRDRVCSLCRKFGYEEVCGVGVDGACPFDMHLEHILEAVLTTPRSADIGAYIPKIREKVCSECANQSDSGTCKSRDHAYCGLDSFLILAVQAVEDAFDRMHPAKANTP